MSTPTPTYPATLSSLLPDPSTVLPLTTVFSAPSTCRQHTYFSYEPVAQTTDINNMDFDASCYPQDFITSRWHEWYSPAICPDQYSTATSTFTMGNMYAFCCPEGYSVWSEGDEKSDEEYWFRYVRGCSKSITSGTFTATNADPDLFLNSDKAVVTSALKVASIVTFTAPTEVLHPMVRIAWNPKDLSKFPQDAMPTFNKANSAEAAAASEVGSVTGAPPAKTSEAKKGSGSKFKAGSLLFAPLVVSALLQLL